MNGWRDRIKRLARRCKPLFLALYALRLLGQRLRLRGQCILHPLDPHLVLFDSFQSRHYNDNPKALYLELLGDERYAAFHCVWVLRDPAAMGQLAAMPRTRVVAYDSPAYRRALTQAGYIVTNSMMPPFFKRRRGQCLIQTWHGTPLKRLGCDLTLDANQFDTVRRIHRRYIRQARQFSWLLSPSAFCSQKFTSAFSLESLHKQDILIERGYPRNDRLSSFTQEEVERLRRELDIPPDAKVVLYAPTFRDNQQQDGEYVYTPALDFGRLADALGDRVILLFRAHYFVASRFDFSRYGGRVRDVSTVEDINDLYLVSDLLITDYSSVFFDYTILHRPVVFYMYDQEEYQHRLRDFYLDLSELPGPIVRQPEELAEPVRRLLTSFVPDARYLAFCQKYNPYEDGHSSHRVWEEVFRRQGVLPGQPAE